MCYRIFTHTMRCDARPVISDGTKVFTDPFAYPLPCSCGPEHFVPRYLRCEDHGCCIKKLEMDWCPNIADCNEVYDVHRYVQSHLKPRNIWGPITMLGDNLSSFWSVPQIQEEVKPWDSVPDLEKCLFTGKMPHLTAVPPPFPQAVQNLVTTGRLIVQTQDQLGALRNEVARRRDMHDGFHGKVCERVINEWECPYQGPIATGDVLVEQMAKNLLKQREIFNTCWTFIQSIMWSRQVGKDLLLKNVPVVWDQ